MTPKDFDTLSNKIAPFAFNILDAVNGGLDQGKQRRLDPRELFFHGFMFCVEAIAVLEELYYKRGGTIEEVDQAFSEFCTVRAGEARAKFNAQIDELCAKSYGGTD